MALRVRPVSILLAIAAVLAVAAVLVPAGNAGLRADAPPAFPTLYVVYTMNCTFTIQDDNGKRVSSIAPGTYQVEVTTPIMFKLVVPGGEAVDRPAANDFSGCKGWVQFQLTGPGVDIFTTLDSGCDAFLLLPAQTFKANATYTAQDLNQPSVTHTALTVQDAGTPLVPNSPYTATSGKGTTFADLVGSKVVKALGGTLAGTLNGGVSTVGKPTLTHKGKTVSTLKAGRYKITVLDETSKGGFTIQKLGKPSVKVTGTTFVGKNSATVKLNAGRWMYSSGPGKAYYFSVTG